MADPTSIAREYLEAWNRRDFDKMRSFFHADYSYTGGDGQTQKGAEAGMAPALMFASALPDGKIDIKSIHATGDVAIIEFTGRGTHQGDLMGIAPTGRKIEMPVCDVLEIRDGKIIAEREYMDMMHMMQQLGVVEAPAGATA
ncbi:MAG: ester cyclase [Dehalococcoidia bacterium]